MQTITALIKAKKYIISYNPAEKKSLSRILKDNSIMLNTACGECGVCKKCKVVLCGAGNNFSVCACTFFPDSDINIIIPESSLLSSFVISDKAEDIKNTSHITEQVYASADIGSTSMTVCIHNDSKILLSTTLSNPTCMWGADIISRIRASLNGKAEELSSVLKDSINTTVTRLLKRLNIPFSKLKKFTISCNNTMQYILLGLNCTSISAYPFASEHLRFNVMSYNELFCETGFNASVYIIPSFGTFIGGDIISGLYSLDILNTDKTFMLLDLGTNAEMVIGNARQMLCTSAASGPAFEAGGLSCGCACMDGAIDTVNLTKRGSNIHVSCTTAGGKIPVGICGSGILSLMSQLISLKSVDTFGTLSEEYIENGFLISKARGKNIVLTQNDIRQLQLAISAIKSGIQILLSEYNASASDIDKVYISGSFGAALDFKTLKNLHILPDEWADAPDVIVTSGNTSLSGAVKYSCALKPDEYINTIISRLSELHLSNHPDFNELFLKNINFHM